MHMLHMPVREYASAEVMETRESDVGEREVERDAGGSGVQWKLQRAARDAYACAEPVLLSDCTACQAWLFGCTEVLNRT